MSTTNAAVSMRRVALKEPARMMMTACLLERGGDRCEKGIRELSCPFGKREKMRPVGRSIRVPRRFVHNRRA